MQGLTPSSDLDANALFKGIYNDNTTISNALVRFPASPSTNSSITSFKDDLQTSAYYVTRSQFWTGLPVPTDMSEIDLTVQVFNEDEDDIVDLDFYIYSGSSNSHFPTFTGLSGSLNCPVASVTPEFKITGSVNLSSGDNLYIFVREDGSPAVASVTVKYRVTYT